MNLNHPSDITMKNYPQNSPGQEERFSLVVKILCIFAAFCLWIYVMMVESPEYEETFSHIIVDLTNTESLSRNNLAIYSGYGTMIDVTLSGKKSVVSKLTEEEIIATADMSAVTSGSGRYDCKVSIDVPAGCKLVGMSQETISVYLDTAAQISVDLIERRDNTNLPEGCYTGSIDFPVDKITVTGPSKYLERITEAVLPLDLTGVTRTTTMTQKIYLVDAYGTKIENQYIQFYPQEVTIEIPVIKMTEVPVEVAFKHGYLNAENTEIIIEPQTITVTGDPEIIDQGNLISAIEIDEKTDFDGNTYDRIVYLEAANGIAMSTNSVELSIKMDQSIKMRQITVPGTNIEDTGGKIGVDYTWDKSPVTVSIIGALDDIISINEEDIILQLDMSPYTKTNTGTIKVRADVIIDSPYADKVLEIGTYDINVTFLN